MKPFHNYILIHKNLSVDKAFNFLYDFGFIDETILIWNPFRNQLVNITLWELLRDTKATRANEIGPIQFSGGPPGNIFWVTGTLWTLCLDKFLTMDALKERLGAQNALRC